MPTKKQNPLLMETCPIWNHVRNFLSRGTFFLISDKLASGSQKLSRKRLFAVESRIRGHISPVNDFHSR